MPIEPPKKTSPIVNTELESTSEDNMLEQFPVELQNEIWQNLDNRSLIALATTNHQIRQAIQDRGILADRYTQYHQNSAIMPSVPKDANEAWQRFITHEKRLDLFRACIRYKQGIVHDSRNDTIQNIQVAPHDRLRFAWIADACLYLWDTRDPSNPVKRLYNSKHLLRVLQFSQDGKQLAASDSQGRILLWDLEDPERPRRQWQTEQKQIISLLFSQNQVVTCAKDKTVKIWDLGTKAQYETGMQLSAEPLQMFFRNEDHNLVTLCQDGELRIWDLTETPPACRSLQATNTAVNRAIVSDNLRYLATASDDGELRICDLQTPDRHGRAILGHTDTITDLLFSADSRHLITASADEMIRIWRLRDFPAVNATLIGHRDVVNALCLASADKYLLSASDDGCVRVWDVNRTLPECTQTFPGYEHDTILGTYLSSDQRFTVHRATIAGTVNVLDRHLTKSTTLDLARHQIPRIHSCAVASTQNTLVTTFEKKAYFWDLNDLSAPTNILTQDRGNIFKSTFSPNDAFFATVSSDHTVRIWSMLQDKNTCHTFHNMPHATDISFSFDSRFLTIWAGTDSQIHAIDLLSEVPTVINLPGYHYGFTHPFFSPDSCFFAAQSRNGTTLIWDMQQSPPIYVNKMSHKSAVRHLAFAKDSTFYATALKHSNTIDVFGRDHNRIYSLSLHEQSNHVTGMDISFGNRFIAAAMSSGRILVWDLRSQHHRMLDLSLHTDSVFKVCFIPDLSVFISASLDQTIRVWDLRDFPTATCQTIYLGADAIQDFSYLPHERSIIVSTAHGTTTTWKIDLGQKNRI